MPHRALAITTRHHPVALGCYVGLTILSFLYISNVMSSAAMSSQVGEHVTRVWEWLLLLGGVLTLIGVFFPSKPLTRLIRGLSIETLGVFVIGIELMVYSAVLLVELNSTPWTTIMVFFPISCGCLARSFTSYKERKKIIKASEQMHPASPIPLGEAD